MHRILLVNPPEMMQAGDCYSNPPLGLLYLAGALRSVGCEFRLVDGYVSGWEGIQGALEEFKPSMVCITSLTPGRHKALRCAMMAKERDPRTLVVLGGIHPTIMWRQLLTTWTVVDAVALGEGEETIKDLARETPFPMIRGLAYKADGRVVKTPPRPPVDMDRLAMPAWDLVSFEDYPSRGTVTVDGDDLTKVPRLPVCFSRGCVGRCSFCSSWWTWKGYRHRSARNMVDELEMLYRMGARDFGFSDDAFTIDRQATLDLCDEIKRRGLKIHFFATTRSDHVDPELLGRLREAGCYEMSFGIESADPLLLKGMNKANTVENAERAIKWCKEAGIRAIALMIAGNVGETWGSVLRSRRFLRRARPDGVGCVGGLWIFPGTTLYTYCKRKGYIDDTFWLGQEPYKVYEMEHDRRVIRLMAWLLVNYDVVKWALGKLERIRGRI